MMDEGHKYPKALRFRPMEGIRNVEDFSML